MIYKIAGLIHLSACFQNTYTAPDNKPELLMGMKTEALAKAELAFASSEEAYKTFLFPLSITHHFPSKNTIKILGRKLIFD
ncbi:MAG: hypothetical protein IPO06_14345 [Leptospiraceae bacterium]|nr:hypothetical protein [Leptospiraceae bacterium]